MGCTSSSEAAPPQRSQSQSPSGGYNGAAVKHAQSNNNGGGKVRDDPQEASKSAGIDRELDRARHQEELKVKLLLLGAGESGKSTIFKQMRILHGSPRSDDDQRMYGVVVRSNVVTATRKLCTLLRTLQLEEQLAAEAVPAAADDSGGGGGDINDNAGADLTPRQAYDVVVAHLMDGTGPPDELGAPDLSADWVGSSPRAVLGANNDAALFLQLWRHIKTLWEVRRRVQCGSFLLLLGPPWMV